MIAAVPSTLVARPGGLRSLLLPDHDDRLELLLEEAVAEWHGADAEDRPRVWLRFVVELRANLEVVERLLLTDFDTLDPIEALALRNSHARIRGLLEEVERERALKVRPVSGALGLERELRALSRRREQKLYPWAVEHLDSSQWLAVRAVMRELMFDVAPYPSQEKP